MGFTEEKEVLVKFSEVVESMSRLRVEMGKEIKMLRKEMNVVKKHQNSMVSAIVQLKKKVGAVEEENKTLKEKMGETETLKEKVGAIEEQTETLKEKVGEIMQEGKRVAKKIQDLKVDALTDRHNSFLDRKAKFDHEVDEKLRTFFLGFTVEILFVASGSLIQHSADLSKFCGWIMTLTVAMSLIFLALIIHLSIYSYDFKSQAKNLETEKKGLESDFRKVIERNGDIEAGTLDDEHAAKMAQAQGKADCLKEMSVRVMPFLCVAGVILVVTVSCSIGQLIFVGKFFKLF